MDTTIEQDMKLPRQLWQPWQQPWQTRQACRHGPGWICRVKVGPHLFETRLKMISTEQADTDAACDRPTSRSSSHMEFAIPAEHHRGSSPVIAIDGASFASQAFPSPLRLRLAIACRHLGRPARPAGRARKETMATEGVAHASRLVGDCEGKEGLACKRRESCGPGEPLSCRTEKAKTALQSASGYKRDGGRHKRCTKARRDPPLSQLGGGQLRQHSHWPG